MIPLKDAKLTKKLKAEVAKEWDVFNAIVEEHSTLSIPQFIKVCPEEYELVKYDKNKRTEYAVFV